MQKFHRICNTIFIIAILNFFLFFFLSALIGGTAPNGKVEGNLYFLGNHGIYRQVSPAIYWFSYYYTYSVIFTHLLGMLAAFLYHITGGGSYAPLSHAYNAPRSKNRYVRLIKRYVWRLVDFIEEIIWVLLDRWRKPDGEWVVQISRKECVLALRQINGLYLSSGPNKKPIIGFFSGNHFYLQKWSYSPWRRDGGIRPVVTGRITPTSRGLYIRVWHRFATLGTVFITIWFGSVLSGLTLYSIGRAAAGQNPEMNVSFIIALSSLFVLPLIYGIVLLLSLWIGSAYGQKQDWDVVYWINKVLSKSSP